MNQSDFAKGLLDPDLPAPDGVVGPNGRTAGKRYDVYRNNVVVSLSEALAAAYPVVKAVVGDAFFDAMAGVYVRKHPPTSPLMIHYGQNFPKFLTKFPPAAPLGYLPDVARLERARREAYHAKDAAPCAAEKLARLEGANFFDAHLHLHPSIRIIRSRYPIFSIWRFNSTKDKSPIGKDREIALISRPQTTVNMQSVSKSTATFFESLGQYSLGVAFEKAKSEDPAFDLTTNLTEILSAGLLVDIT